MHEYRLEGLRSFRFQHAERADHLKEGEQRLLVDDRVVVGLRREIVESKDVEKARDEGEGQADHNEDRPKPLTALLTLASIAHKVPVRIDRVRVLAAAAHRARVAVGAPHRLERDRTILACAEVHGFARTLALEHAAPRLGPRVASGLRAVGAASLLEEVVAVLVLSLVGLLRLLRPIGARREPPAVVHHELAAGARDAGGRTPPARCRTGVVRVVVIRTHRARRDRAVHVTPLVVVSPRALHAVRVWGGFSFVEMIPR